MKRERRARRKGGGALFISTDAPLLWTHFFDKHL
jgi:hypothetical protein